MFFSLLKINAFLLFVIPFGTLLLVSTRVIGINYCVYVFAFVVVTLETVYSFVSLHNCANREASLGLSFTQKTPQNLYVFIVVISIVHYSTCCFKRIGNECLLSTENIKRVAETKRNFSYR